MFLLLVGTYFYARMQFTNWPPPGSNTQGLLLPAINLLILVVSCIPMHVADKAILRSDWETAAKGMWANVALGFVALAIQIYLWSRFEFSWYANLYGSVIWVMLGVHTMHMVASLIESTVLTVAAMLGYKNDRVRLGSNVDEIYWFFVVIMAVILYAVVFLAPRII
jgi:cytochrome c oxidase subunit I+III